MSFKQRLLHPEARLAYLMMLPASLFILLFMFYPVLHVVMMSIHDTTRLGHLRDFAGLRYYNETFSDPVFWRTIGRTVVWTVVAVLVKTIVGMIIALLLNQPYRGRRFSRMLFIIPWASSVPISAIIWRWVLNHEFGLMNHTLKSLGIWARPPVWLGEPLPAFISNLWVDTWIGIPFMALVFLAGMQGISADLYESAEIDGAGALTKFSRITLPGIRHIIIIATLLSALWTFNDFNVVWIMTKGGPAGLTDILITALYKSAFEWLRFSRAAVLAVVTFVVLMALALSYARLYFKGEND
ncbi:MAG: sugar ABC transporter permease [Spirochaetaceae bacterium]|nr:MAG: sugar ABC transporter permease [Spirochaetaceae bacterium]